MSAELPREIMLAGLLVQQRMHSRWCAFLAKQASSIRPRIAGALNRRADVALSIEDRDAVLAVLVKCPNGLLDLRATLLQEEARRHREGL
jgi:hypothetical protein